MAGTRSGDHPVMEVALATAQLDEMNKTMLSRPKSAPGDADQRATVAVGQPRCGGVDVDGEETTMVIKDIAGFCLPEPAAECCFVKPCGSCR